MKRLWLHKSLCNYIDSSSYSLLSSQSELIFYAATNSFIDAVTLNETSPHIYHGPGTGPGAGRRARRLVRGGAKVAGMAGPD